MAEEGSSLEKSAILRRHIDQLVARGIEPYLTVRLLLSGKQHDLRTYQLKDRSMLAHLATVLRASEAEMLSHLE